MKIAVFSDSHNDIETMYDVVETIKPDMIIHLGDCISDAIRLKIKYPDIPIEYVKGNNDRMYDHASESLLELENVILFITHGDEYGVKHDLDDVISEGMLNCADIILFGHTHIPYLSRHDNVWVMNPGRIGRKSVRLIDATYGIINLENSKIECSIVEYDLI